jgi:peptide/nickel transport system substrate-binding protein
MMRAGTRTSTRRRLVTACVAAGLLALQAACTASAGTRDVAVMASGTDLESANPLVTVHSLSRQVQRHALFVTLVRLESSLRAEPYFARRWEWTADRRTVTCVLADNLRWHDGVPTTADDVRFTIRSAQDPALGSPRRADLDGVDSVVVVNAHTLRLHFRAPQQAWPAIFAELPIVPRHLLDTVPLSRWRTHPYSTAPVGNGPFRFASRVPGRQWRFAANPQFPAAMGGPPRLRELVIAVVDEPATKFAGLVSGDLDLAGVSPTMARLVARDPALELVSPPVLYSMGLAFNTTRPPFDDVRVRRALSEALNREQIIDAAVAGFGVPAYSAIPAGLPMSPVRIDRRSPRARAEHRADSLLDAAGWTRNATGTRERRGQPLAVTLLTVGSGDLAIEQLVQSDFAARGIDLTIRVMEMASFLATVRAPAKSFDLVLTGITGDLALGHLSAMFASSQRGGALDYTGYHHVALDSALQQARAAEPGQERTAWSGVDRWLQEAAPVAWVYHARGVQGKARTLVGVTMDLRGELATVAEWSRSRLPEPAQVP